VTPTLEQEARQHIDVALKASGWVLQDRAEINLAADSGVAVREFKMALGHGFADYLLLVQGNAVGVLEAKPAHCALDTQDGRPHRRRS
jgi:type I restriction enzyme R subunit